MHTTGSSRIQFRACVVACLHPHNSISNVVVSLTIIFFVFLSETCSKKHETILEGPLTEHHGKCLASKSFVKLGFCLCVSVSLCLSLSLSLWLLWLWLFGTLLHVCVCPIHITRALSYLLILGVQTWRRGPAPAPGIIPPHSCFEQEDDPHHADRIASS